MRQVLWVAGLLLIVGGVYVLVSGGSVSTRENVLDVGDMQVSTTRRTPIEPWMAWAGIITGGALVAVGFSRKV